MNFNKFVRFDHIRYLTNENFVQQRAKLMYSYQELMHVCNFTFGKPRFTARAANVLRGCFCFT